MAATAQWHIPFKISSPYGDLLINQLDPTVNGYYLLDPSGCRSKRTARVTRENRSQASGEITRPHFTGGYEMTLKMLLSQDADHPACDELLVDMWDFLELHVDSMLGDDVVSNQLLSNLARITWDPTSKTQRMLDQVRTVELPQDSEEGAGAIAATFQVVTRFPYAMDAPQTVTNIPAGSGGVVIINTGSAPFFPVVKVYGAFAGFHLTNQSVLDADGNPLQIVYNDALPGAVAVGGGHYAELAFFDETVYLDGNVADLKAGIDITASDFWPLVPGPNIISITGASADILWQPAYG